MTLTVQDLDLLIEAADAWVHKGDSSLLMGSLLGGMLSRTPEERDEHMQKTKEEARQRDRDIRIRKERAVVVQAKLIQMRDALAGEQATRLIDKFTAGGEVEAK